jgi:hypothetical protein
VLVSTLRRTIQKLLWYELAMQRVPKIVICEETCPYIQSHVLHTTWWVLVKELLGLLVKHHPKLAVSLHIM